MGKTIEIDVKAGTASFIDGMDRAGHSVDRLGQKADESRGFLDRFKEGFEIGAGVEAARASLELLEKPLDELKEAFEEVNEIGRGALKLGTTDENMSRLEHAAHATGVEVGTLTTGIGRLNEQIGKVASGDQGAKQAADALEKLHLDAKELATLDPAETFQRVSEAVAGMGDAYQRAAVVQELMGRGGRELIPVMEHVQELMRESDEIGFTRTPEQIKAAEEEERKFAQMTDGLKGELMDLATSDFGQHLVEEFKNAAEGAKYLLDSVSGASAKQFDKMNARAWELFRELEKPHAPTGGLDEQLRQQEAVVAKARELKSLDVKMDASDANQDHAATMKSLLAADQRLRAEEKVLDGLKQRKKAEDEAAAAAKQGAEAAAAAKKAADDAAIAAEEQRLAQEEARQKKLAADARRMWEEARTPAQKYIDTVKELDEALKEHLITEEQYLQMFGKARDDYNKANDKDEQKGFGSVHPYKLDDDEHDRDRQASLLSRSFDFSIVGKGQDPAQAQALAEQKRTNDLLKEQVDVTTKLFSLQFGTMQPAAQQDNVLDLS